MVAHAGSPTRTVYVDVTLSRSKVNVKVTGLLNWDGLTLASIHRWSDIT